MEISGVNNKSIIGFQVDKKVFYQFLETPLDKVQLSSQNPDKKEKKQDDDLKEVADILDPKKNYKRIAAKVAGVAGASALILGISIAALLRGKSGTSEKVGNYLQKLRGQAYNLKNENSIWANMRYHAKTKVVNFIEKGLNVWVNTEWFKNYFLSEKIIKKIGFINKPVEWAVGKFGDAIKWRSHGLYENCAKDVNELANIFPDMKKIIENGHNDRISSEVIDRLKKNHPYLKLQGSETRAEVAEKLVKAIVEQQKKIEGEFPGRQVKLGEILDRLADGYKDEYSLFSAEGGAKKYFEGGMQDIKKLIHSGKELQAKVSPQMKDIKTEKADLYKLKEIISRNVNDNYKRNIELLKKLEDNIVEVSQSNNGLKERYNEDLFNHIRNLENVMKSYKNAETNAGKGFREIYAKTFVDKSKELAELLEKSGYNKDGKLNDGIDCLKQAANRITEDKPGLLEEFRILLNDYDSNGKNLIKEKNGSLYSKIKRIADNISKSNTKSVEFEADNVTFRRMDLRLGGGDFEVLGLATPIGFGIYSFTKGDSHEERVSNGIRSGAVIGGGLLGWVLSGAILGLSASKAIGFSLGAGLLFDKVGKFIDNEFWSKGKDWDAINKQKKLDAKALKHNVALSEKHA